MTVLKGHIVCKGRAFPIDIGTSVPETQVSPIISAMSNPIYLSSHHPSECMKQMLCI
ncbi:unnamed protein product [Musa acuminata subsp. malaccensis]|uniref:Uncharacterized protein n=1 Tax=Musa acuminata subsp. malaccensis TaxID=214687 RepID=A0A804U654_MUSAM|nr:unnamed protein product [Musa acuminata subsp. malaccensis]